MPGRPKFKDEGESSQEVVERVAQISDVLFNAPHPFFTYGLMLLLPLLIIPLFPDQLREDPEDSILYVWRNAYLLFALPAFVAGLGGWRLAKLYGGTFNRRRAGFVSLVSQAIVILVTIVGGLIHRRGTEQYYSFYDPIILGYAYTIVIQHVALFTTSDHRQIRSAQVAALQPVLGLLFLHLLPFETTGRQIVLTVVLPLVFLATTAYFLDLVDAPVKRNTGLSLSEMFRHYLDHLAKGTLAAEQLILRIAGEIDAFLGVVGFRKLSGELKAGLIVPAVHPGPVGHLGGSNLPAKVIQATGLTRNLLVPHGPATHDFNPASRFEVERIGESARQLLQSIEWSEEASPLVRSGVDVQVCAQIFGGAALLVYTSWPKPIDDVDYGVGDSAMWSSKHAGAREAAFVDAHNSLLLGSGAVWPSDRRAISIIETSGDATRAALARRSTGIRAGYAATQDAFTRPEGVGEQGCQVLVTEVNGKKSALILWDGNNMLPEVRGRIRERVQDIVDEFEVMTTDNHSVNIVAGGYNPVGYRADVEKLALVSRTTLERAILDLEPVQVGLKTGRIPGLKVVGHWNTIRLVSSANTIASLIPRAALLLLVLHLLFSILILTWANHYL